jgi:hypothetical protein
MDQNREFDIWLNWDARTSLELTSSRGTAAAEMEVVAVLARSEPWRVGPREAAVHHDGHVLRGRAVPGELGGAEGVTARGREELPLPLEHPGPRSLCDVADRGDRRTE